MQSCRQLQQGHRHIAFWAKGTVSTFLLIRAQFNLQSWTWHLKLTSWHTDAFEGLKAKPPKTNTEGLPWKWPWETVVFTWTVIQSIPISNYLAWNIIVVPDNIYPYLFDATNTSHSKFTKFCDYYHVYFIQFTIVCLIFFHRSSFGIVQHQTSDIYNHILFKISSIMCL